MKLLVWIYSAVLLLAALSLFGCASLPQSEAALRAENQLLRRQLRACETDVSQCSKLLKECEVHATPR